MNKEQEDYIIEKRENGETLQSIVDGLKEIYDFETTKQNVHKFYKRYCERDLKQLEDDLLSKDVIEVVIRKRYIKDCCKIDKIGNLSLYKINKILKNNSEELEVIKSLLEEKIIDLYCNGESVDNIGNKLAYKGINLDVEVINKVIKEHLDG